MILVGLTGVAASGKSTVARLFEKRGERVIDADRIVRSLMRPGTAEHRRIVRRFGRGILRSSGTIDRRRLRALALARAGGFGALERILHPGVRRIIRSEARALRPKPGLLVIEVPLLYEAGFDKEVDFTITVSCKKSRQVLYARRKGWDREALKVFSERQWPQRKKEEKSDFVIRNNGTIRDLKKKVKQISQRLTGR